MAGQQRDLGYEPGGLLGRLPSRHVPQYVGEMRNRHALSVVLGSGLLLSACGGLPNGSGPPVQIRASYDKAQAAALCHTLFGTDKQVGQRFGLPKLVSPLEVPGHQSVSPMVSSQPATWSVGSPNERLVAEIGLSESEGAKRTPGIGCAWRLKTATEASPPNLYFGFVLPKYHIPNGPFGIGRGPQVDIVAVDTLGKPPHPMSHYDAWLTRLAQRIRLANG